MGKKVMILSVKAGAGHLQAARALELAFQSHYPEIEVRNLDALEYTNKAFRKSFTSGYETLARDLPSIWGMLYEHLEESSERGRTKRLATFFDQMNSRPLRKEVKKFEPDAIIATHYLPGEVFGGRRLKGKLDCPLFTVLTDYDIHPMWINNGIDHYFVATEEMAFALRQAMSGVAEITISGIPVLPVFSEGYPSRDEMRERLGLSPGVPTVLMSAGGFGLFALDALLEMLVEMVENVQFLAVAGKNAALQQRLERVAEANPGRVVPYGFVSNMHELMAAADFAVTKCGGLTTSECLVMGLPMVVTKPIPGQEERNADYLLEHGAAVRANSLAHVVYKVQRLLAHPERVEAMREAARETARPYAARTIAETVVRAL